MVDASRSLVEWRELAEATPACAAVQIDGEFAYVSENLAATLGAAADDLAGESWRSPFAESAVGRLERGLALATAEGEWTGAVAVDGRRADDGSEERASGTTLEFTLSAMDGDAVAWTAADRDPDSASTSASADPSSASRRSVPASDAEPNDTKPNDAESNDTEPNDAKPNDAEPNLVDPPAFVHEVLDVVDDVVYVIDEDGQFRLWNEALVETTGYSREELAGMHPSEVIPADQQEYVPGLLDAIDAIEDRRVEVDILAKDGERITHEFQGATFEDPETGESFRCGVARDVTDRKERERELERYETIVETVDDGVYALDDGVEFTFVNEALCELFDATRERILGSDGTELFDRADELEDAEAVRERLLENGGRTGTIRGTFSTPEGERILESRYRLHPEPDGEFRGSVGVVRDVTERERRQRTLERQRDELATLDRINELLLETVRELVGTASREAVERAVCERLAESELYQFAWIGEREFGGDRVVDRTTAGEDRGYLDAVTITADEGGTGTGPAGRALRTGEVRVADVADEAFEPWRAAASERGFESVAAVPLHHGGTVYGVLVVYATRSDAFSEREQAGFDVLGRTVGSVVHAARSRELLFADAVVELEFRVAGTDPTFAHVAAETDCTLSLEGYVPSGDRWVLYLAVEGASPDDVIAVASDDDRIERARVVTEGDDGGRIELVVAESSLLHVVTGAGATLRSARADADGTELLVEAPVDADVRAVVKRVQEAYPGAELVAHRKHDHEVTTVGRPGGLLDELTDRQREALEAAYRTGYFAWPRESTAEEVAASLDLSSPTLHGHLRKAERTLLSELFDAGE